MNVTKRLPAAIMSMALAVCLAGCGAGEEKKDGNYHIGICQWQQHAALDEATKGFQDALKEKLGDKVVFDVRLADGDAEMCQDILNSFAADEVDLIMANATNALKTAVKSTNTIPIVATSITDYGTALNMREWNGVTGLNVTGTSDLAPIEKQADMIEELVPDVRKVGILYCSTETNSIFQAQKMGGILTARGISFSTYTIADKKELERAARMAATECDILYVPTDNTIAAEAPALREILTAARIPMIAGEEGLCGAANGTATLSISYYEIGYTAGEMACDILQEGRNPGEIQIRYAEGVTKKYNPVSCEELGITVPDDYVAIN